jgi:hypothetical protein
MEKRLLQIAVAIGGLVPVGAGMFGGLRGLLFFGESGDIALDSHLRYLSGLLLAIGVGFWSCIPDIERQSLRFGLLTLIVVTGGFFRAVGMLMNGTPGLIMTLSLLMELAVTPALYLWQSSLAKRSPIDAAPAAR